MIITRTPFRISFAGGGSDLKSYYKNNTGSVLSVAIQKYIYIVVHPFFDKNNVQLKYSKTELVSKLEEIKHPIFREAMLSENLYGVDINSIADIPAGTGLGSSSSFTVGLLNAIHAYKGNLITKKELAEKACEIEIEKLQTPIGKQDQYAAAFGGLNNIKFYADESVKVTAVNANSKTLKELEGNLFLVYTGQSRSANLILEKQSQLMQDKEKNGNVLKMTQLSFKLQSILENSKDLDEFGYYLHQGWELKKSLMASITNTIVDNIYIEGIDAGALGGKLLGAGNGGFILFYCPVSKQHEFKSRMKKYLVIDVKFETCGSEIIYQN
jgi:D-glycero-alpha-D-manno-heptose-7-phosphate kinase